MVNKLTPSHYKHIKQLIEKGSFNDCCKYLQQHHLAPIQGAFSLKCFVLCVNDIESLTSPESLVKFINYLEFDENTKKNDARNFLLCVYHVFYYLIQKGDWPSNINKLMHLITPIINYLPPEQAEIYCGVQNVLVSALHKTTLKFPDETVTKLLSFIITLQETYKRNELLPYFTKLTATLPRKSYSAQLGQLVIITIIKNNCNIFTLKDLKNLLAILRNSFMSLETIENSYSYSDLIKCIKILNDYSEKSTHKKEKGFQELFNYLASSTVMFSTIDLLNLEDDLFLGALTAINRVFKLVSSTALAEVVMFCTNIQGKLVIANRQIVNSMKPVNFTKALNSSLHAYVSHAKSQAIILKHSELREKCCCSITTNICGSFRVQINALSYLEHVFSLIEDVTQVSADLYKALEKVLKNCMDLLDVLKNAGCKRLDCEWDYFCRAVYNFNNKLANPKALNILKMFVEILVKGALKFDANDYIINEQCSIASFHQLARCLVGFKRWDDAMDICALGIRLFYKNSTNIVPLMSLWDNIMYNCKGTETWCDVFVRNSKYLQNVCEGFELKPLNEKEKIDLYKMEVENYFKRFKIWSRIEKCLGALVNLTCAEDYLTFLMELPFEIVDLCLMKAFLQKYPSFPQENKLISGVYHFLRYKQEIYEARENFKQFPKIRRFDVIKSDDHQDEKENEEPFALNYSHLSLKVHDGIVQHLKASLNDLSTIQHKNTKMELNPMLLDLVIQIGHEFELQCYEANAQQAWSLALHIANKLKSFEKYLHAATFLLRYEGEANKNLIPTCQKILESSNDMNIFTKFTFYIHLAMFYLKTHQINEFRVVYQTAHEMFYEFGGSFHREEKREDNLPKIIATGYFALLIGMTEMLPCRDVVDEMHGCHTFQIPMHAWYFLLNIMNNPNVGVRKTELFSLFFMLGEHIVWKCYWTGMYRHSERFAKSVVNYAENTISTFRVCRMLIFLGKTKMKQKQVEVTQRIVSDLELILEIVDDNSPQEEEESLHKRFESRLLIRASSPVVLKQFKNPQFLGHEKCNCTPCTLREYQICVIEKFHLDVLIANDFNDQRTLENLLKGCFNLFKNLQRRKLFYCEDSYVDLLWTQVKILRQHKDSSKFEQSLNVLCELLERRKFGNYYLNNDVNSLKFMLLVEARRKNLRKKCIKFEDEKILRDSGSKTPENRDKNDASYHTPVSVALPLEIETHQSEKKNFLEVPEIGQPKTRLRGKRILYTQLEDVQPSEKSTSSKSSTAKDKPTTSKAKGSKIAVSKKSTRSTVPKTMR